MSSTVDNAVRLVGDLGLVPGTSQILKGEYKSGLLHAGVGIASRLLLASSPIGLVVWVAAAANSYSLSVNDKNLLAYKGGESDAPPTPAASTSS